MLFRDLLKQIFFSLWTHKVRTCLALFGIVWGTVSVIVLLAISNGFYAKQLKNLDFLQKATIFAWGGIRSKAFEGLPPGQKIHIQIDDFLKIMNKMTDIAAYTPVFNTAGEITYQDKSITGPVLAVSSDFSKINELHLTPGSRFIDPHDIQKNRPVVVIDDQSKITLFGSDNAIGKTIMINHMPFKVIGVNSVNQSSAIRFMENSFFIPYTTYMAITGQKDLHLFFVQPNHVEKASHIKKELIHSLAAVYHFDPDDEEAIRMPDLASSQLFFTWFFRAIALFLGCCGGLTLSVGGLGVANMMFLIVTERTREIGLRMALGADQKSIMSQFLCETLFLVGLGGMIGFFISILIILFSHQLKLPTWLGTPQISWITLMMTLTILTFVGFLAGYFPARRASLMEPIKALAFK